MMIPALVSWYDYVKTKDRAVLRDALHPDAGVRKPGRAYAAARARDHVHICPVR